jgi:hypothetical protein
MILNSTKTSFGRHETFALRYSWLTKGYQTDKKVFNSDSATVELGVGKNMVKSIQYWLKACRIVDDNMEHTPIGDAIFHENGFDPYLEDEATIWLIHWLLVTNSELATAWYWFFNHFHKPEFSAQEVQTALVDFAKEKLKARTSVKTVQNDASLILRMYTQNRINKRTPLEESLDSPLSLLRLISHSPDGRQYFSKSESRPQLPLGILGYAIADLFMAKDVSTLPIEELMYSKSGYIAPGLVFRLTENDLISRLEILVNYIPGKFEIRETAGIHQLYRLDDIEPIEFLNKHYGLKSKGVVSESQSEGVAA